MIDGILKNVRVIVMEVKVLKDNGVYIIVVGVGCSLVRKELINIVLFF